MFLCCRRGNKKSFESVEELLQSQKPLGIFSQDTKAESGSSLKFWEKFRQAELRRSTRFEPLNWFDQCIVWTEEGKLWKFPIDNEQGKALKLFSALSLFCISQHHL